MIRNGMRCKIAITGMGAILPDAMDLSEYWSNILAAKDSIKDVSPTYWEIEDFYHPDPTVRDKSYGYKAGEVSPVLFDSIGFGIPPKVMESISVEQLYALVVAKQALLDADLIGNHEKEFNREKAGVIMAATVGKSAFALSRRQDIPQMKKILKNSGLPDEVIERIVERTLAAEIEWNENSEPGFLANVVAGRIANRFDLHGTNCAVDAACASSMAALKMAIHELQSGDCDVVLTGGVNLDLTSTAFISFCKTPAISKSNVSRPFDADADGMILGDGVAMVVLKRLEDAKRDGNRIYAVIEAMGSSGDGRATSIFAPNREGQLRALKRAYAKTDLNPNTISLIEAHGTGTFVGDATEISALTQFFEDYDVNRNSIAIGSVKSQVGHSRLTAGMSSLIKTALALYHRTLPPTINVKTDRPDMLASPFYTLATPQPWLTDKNHPIRRAGVSSFGFGGTNFHVILEEYREGSDSNWRRAHQIPTSICLDGGTRAELLELCKLTAKQIDSDEQGYQQLMDCQQKPKAIMKERPRVGFVAKEREDAKGKLQRIIQMLQENPTAKEITLAKEGIYFREGGMPTGKVVTLFSGQGSQYLGMFSELARDYPEMTSFLSFVEEQLEAKGLRSINEILYGAGKKIPHQDAEVALNNTKYTQPILAAVCGGLYEIVKSRGFEEDAIIGHSFGELTGLWAGGAIDAKTFVNLAACRGGLMSEGSDNTGMISITADVTSCEKWLKDYRNLYIANENSLTQTVVSGDIAEIKELEGKLRELNISSIILNVSQGFHSPYMAEASKQFATILAQEKFSTLKKTLYSGAEGKPYKKRGDLVKSNLAKQIESSVRFAKCIEDAYENGGRVFVEIGPGRVLTNLTNRILVGKEHYTVAVNGASKHQSANEQLEEALTQLRVLGMELTGDLYRKTKEERFKGEKPKSAYEINPMGYVTPEKKEIIKEAIELEESPHQLLTKREADNAEKVYVEVPDQPVTPEMEDNEVQINYQLEDVYNREGELVVAKSTLEAVLGLQKTNTKALGEYLASQEKQIDVFKDLFQEASHSGAADHVVRFIEIFQNNSLRAFETYMGRQQGIIGGANSSIAHLEDALEIENSSPVLVSPKISTTVKGEAETVVYGNGGDVPNGAASMEDSPVSKVAVSAPVPVSTVNDIDLSDFDPVQLMIGVISEKSGYPEELIDAEMNIEADLGIDSIKRIEIFAEIGKQMPGEIEQEDVEAISMLHTIQEIGDYIRKKV